MNTMSLQSFGAESSLYKSIICCYGLSNGGMQADKGVVPSVILCSETCQLIDGKVCVKSCMNCSGRPGAPFCDQKTFHYVNCSPSEC
jgi:hypothetical protein